MIFTLAFSQTIKSIHRAAFLFTNPERITLPTLESQHVRIGIITIRSGQDASPLISSNDEPARVISRPDCRSKFNYKRVQMP